MTAVSAHGGIGSLWESLEQPWRICLEEAWQAYCAGSLPIGAVVIGPDGTPLSRGRNRRFSDRSDQRQLCGSNLAHAELNALLTLEEAAANPRDCTLYTTTEPCPLCVGAITMANVRRVCYASRDPWAGCAELFQSSRYIASKRTVVSGPPREDLELVIMVLWIEYALQVWGEKARRVLAAWAGIVPLSMAIGEELARSGELAAWRGQGASVSSVVNLLSERAALLGMPQGRQATPAC